MGKNDTQKILSVESSNVMEKHFLKLKFAERNDCHEFKSKYEKIPFNGKVPKVTVFLGND